jgi:hypothetical protein
MANNPKQKHKGHPKRIIRLSQGGSGPGRHYGRIECVLCKEFVAWASKEQVQKESQRVL